jgi:hypothetical protein
MKGINLTVARMAQFTSPSVACDDEIYRLLHHNIDESTT